MFLRCALQVRAPSVPAGGRGVHRCVPQEPTQLQRRQCARRQDSGRQPAGIVGHQGHGAQEGHGGDGEERGERQDCGLHSGRGYSVNRHQGHGADQERGGAAELRKVGVGGGSMFGAACDGAPGAGGGGRWNWWVSALAMLHAAGVSGMLLQVGRTTVQAVRLGF